jgi:hypothetical protein
MRYATSHTLVTPPRQCAARMFRDSTARKRLWRRAATVIAEKIPSLSVHCPVVDKVVSVKRNRGPFWAHDDSRRNDEPHIFGNDVGSQEIKIPPLVEFAPGARMDAAHITPVRLPVGGGFDLHAHEVPAGLDDHIVARRISPRLGQPETVLGGSGHKLKLGPLPAPFAIL